MFLLGNYSLKSHVNIMETFCQKIHFKLISGSVLVTWEGTGGPGPGPTAELAVYVFLVVCVFVS